MTLWLVRDIARYLAVVFLVLSDCCTKKDDCGCTDKEICRLICACWCAGKPCESDGPCDDCCNKLLFHFHTLFNVARRGLLNLLGLSAVCRAPNVADEMIWAEVAKLDNIATVIGDNGCNRAV